MTALTKIVMRNDGQYVFPYNILYQSGTSSMSNVYKTIETSPKGITILNGGTASGLPQRII